MVSDVMPAPAVEMLWESVDPHQALASRFGFADVGQVARWVTETLAEIWGAEVVSCDRVVVSAGNVLVWTTTSTGPMILKWSARPSLFARLANIARLTSWLDGRGVPVSAPVPALSGDLQVQRNGFSIALQSVVDGSALEPENPAQVEAAGAALAALHLALADYPHAGGLGHGGQADARPLRTRIEGMQWASPPSDTEVPPPQLVHLDFRSANVLCDGDRVSAILDFEEAGVDFAVDDLAKAAVLLGTQFRQWGPVSPETHDTFVAGYRAVRDLSTAEAAWLRPLMLWRTLRLGWAESAGQLAAR
jgi:homoserine kinase type II